MLVSYLSGVVALNLSLCVSCIIVFTGAQVLQPVQCLCRLAISTGGWARPGHGRRWPSWPCSPAVSGGMDACAGAELCTLTNMGG